MAEAQAWPGHGELEPGGAFLVSEGLVAEPEREIVHRAAGRDAYLPQAGTAGPVLDRGLQPGPFHGDPWFRIADVIQGSGAMNCAADRVQPGHRAQHSEVGLDTVDPGVLQRRTKPVERLVPVGSGGDDLGQQWVVVGGDLAAGFNPRVHPDAVGGRVEGVGHGSGAWLEVAGRILRVEAGLDGVAGHRDAVRPAGQHGFYLGAALGQPQHPFHQVHAGDGLGDGVLDLEPGIDFKE